MPDLVSPILASLPTVLTFGRFALAAYAVAATILTTACLSMQAVTAIDRRTLRRRDGGTGAQRGSQQPLFTPLEPVAKLGSHVPQG